MDILFLREFRLDIIIGIYEWERKARQPVVLDLEIGLPDRRACDTDQVEHTINYAEVAARIHQTTAEREFMLVEALGEHVAALILEEFKAPWVRVTVSKLAIVRGVKALGIVMERGRPLE